MGWCGLTFLGAGPACSPVPARTSLAPGVGPNPQPPRRTAAFVRSTHGGEDIAVASLNTTSAQTRHPLSNSQHQPQGQQTTVGTTDRWTSLRDAGRASTDINPRCQQDMAGVTSHRTTPEDIRPEQGGIGTHRSGNRGQGAHESPPVTAESSPHFRVTITEDLQLLFDHETHVRGRCRL